MSADGRPTTPARPRRRSPGRRGTPQRRLPDPPRRVAYDLLRTVEEDGAYANLALPALLRRAGLTGRDAAFATELAYGSVRGRGTVDAVLAACSTRPLTELDPRLLDALRLGAHQLLAMRVPAHAAVSSTVDLVASVAGAGAARYANAVLRRVADADLGTWVGRVAPSADDDPVGHLAVAQSHPRWVVEAFRDALDGDLAEVSAALRSDNVGAPVTLVARPGRSTVAELVAAGAEPGRWSPYAARLLSGDPGDVKAVRERRAAVQDEGSQLVALALAAAPIDGPDRLWADLAAGPGGKAALLGALAAGGGARVLAVERRAHRAALVARATGGAPVQVLVADSTVPAWAPASLDRVLVDVPCTGLGALRRRPEARWRRTPDDLADLGRLQRALLSAALDAARPGGLVAYATCSPHLAETRAVVAAVRAGRRDVEPVDVRPLWPDLPHLGAGPDVQLWPHRHGTDAMYLSLLRRTGR